MDLLPGCLSEVADLHLLTLIGLPLAIHAVTRGALRLPRPFRLLVHLGARDERDERGPDGRNPHASSHSASSAQRWLRTVSSTSRNFHARRRLLIRPESARTECVKGPSCMRRLSRRCSSASQAAPGASAALWPRRTTRTGHRCCLCLDHILRYRRERSLQGCQMLQQPPSRVGRHGRHPFLPTISNSRRMPAGLLRSRHWYES